MKSSAIREKCERFVQDNAVTLIFAVLCLIAFKISELTFTFVVSDLIERIERYGLLVLSLIIPVLAGMGLNFGIVLGAICGQVGLIYATYWGIEGVPAVLAAAALGGALATVFGYATGVLFNKIKGQEMIAGMVLGYFSGGVYQFVFLILAGTSIMPFTGWDCLLPGGIGLQSTIALNAATKACLGSIWKVRCDHFVLVALGAIILLQIGLAARDWAKCKKQGGRPPMARRIVAIAASAAGILAVIGVRDIATAMQMNKIPVVSFLIIGAAGWLIDFISKTKLGQDIRTVGQSMPVAKASGIAVDKIRITATVMSMVLAAFGQIMYMVNMGNMTIYTAHEQVGLFSVAALLVGGASIVKANVRQALLGLILFHALYIIAPTAGRILIGDSLIGEYFRTFISYGIIAVSLVLYAARHKRQKRAQMEMQ